MPNLGHMYKRFTGNNSFVRIEPGGHDNCKRCEALTRPNAELSFADVECKSERERTACIHRGVLVGVANHGGPTLSPHVATLIRTSPDGAIFKV